MFRPSRTAKAEARAEAKSKPAQGGAAANKAAGRAKKAIAKTTGEEQEDVESAALQAIADKATPKAGQGRAAPAVAKQGKGKAKTMYDKGADPDPFQPRKGRSAAKGLESGLA
jgi:hypothetical protein